jgi:effector-binding domain-containing protein
MELSPTRVRDLELEERRIFGVREIVADPGELFARALPRIFGALTEAGVPPAGAPLGIYYSVDEEAFDMAVAVPVDASVDAGDGLFNGHLPGGRALAYDHHGSYDTLTSGWQAFMALVEEAGHAIRAEAWEDYHTGGPDSGMPPEEWITTLVAPIA